MLGFEMVETLQNLHIHRKVLLNSLDLLPNCPQQGVERDIQPPQHLQRCQDGGTMSSCGYRGNRGGQCYVARRHVA